MLGGSLILEYFWRTRTSGGGFFQNFQELLHNYTGAIVVWFLFIMVHWLCIGRFEVCAQFVGILRRGNGHLVYRRLRSLVSLHHASNFLANCQTFRRLVQTLSSYRPSQNQKHAFFSLSLSLVLDTRRVSNEQNRQNFLTRFCARQQPHTTCPKISTCPRLSLFWEHHPPPPPPSPLLVLTFPTHFCGVFGNNSPRRLTEDT